MTSFDRRTLRDAFGTYMTGVTVVTTTAPSGEPVGFTANSFTSVSLDPPLLLVCPGKFLSTHAIFAECTHFAVSILSEGQEAVSNVFASCKGDRFAQVPHGIDCHGVPVIDGAAAQFSCAVERTIDAGDHTILLGAVKAFKQQGTNGLGYAGGRYFSLGLERAAVDQGRSGPTTCGAIIEQGNTLLLERTANGYRPPQVALHDRGALRQALSDGLSTQGVPVRLTAAYSIFEEDDRRLVYLLATSDAVPTGTIEAIPIGDLPQITYTTQPIAKMMARFAIEAPTRSFGLYLGDDQRGDVHAISERI